MSIDLGRTRVEPHADPAVALLLDRAAVRDVILRYSHCVDHREFDELATCFTPDVSGNFGGEWRANRDDLIEFISGVRFFKTTMHMMGNAFVEIDGDRASLESYAMVMHYGIRGDGSVWRFNLSDSIYVEKLVRGPEGWAVQQRAAEPAWSPRGVRAVASDDAAVRWLLDRAAIHDSMMQYALGVDRREYDRVRDCFAKSFRAAYQGEVFTDVESLIDALRAFETYESTTHFLGTPLVSVDGDRARVHALAYTTVRQPGEERDRAPESATTASHFLDVWERQTQGWRLTRRDVSDAAPERAIAPGVAPETGDPSVRSLIDRAQISDLVSRTAHGLDRRDFEGVAACFAGAGVAFVETAREQLDRFSATGHLVGNHLVAIDDASARSETYVYGTQRASPAQPASHWSRGAVCWDDRFIRGPDGWRIAERQVRVCSVA